MRFSPALALVLLLSLSGRAQFSDYWHQGKAEICRYELTRLRYGEERAGYAVFIFVTEDLCADKHVKDERGAGDQAVNVMKLNRIERFATGLYDYSLMASTFTATKAKDETLPPTLKVTASIQDWCGHVWLQANRRGGQFDITGHSYFEAEADESATVPVALLEDEVFTQIRLDPKRLPTGAISVLPGVFHARLDHRPLRVAAARAELVDLPSETGPANEQQEYRLAVDLGGNQRRWLIVRFAKSFPHQIAGFEERLDRGDSSALVVSGRLATTTRIDYWNKNKPQDDPLRAELGLGLVR